MNIDVEAFVRRLIELPLETQITLGVATFVMLWALMRIVRSGRPMTSPFPVIPDRVRLDVHHHGFPEIPESFNLTVEHRSLDRSEDEDVPEIEKRPLTPDHMSKFMSMVSVHQAHLKTLYDSDDSDNDGAFLDAVMDLREHCTHFVDHFEPS